jgi:hypothetical protein
MPTGFVNNLAKSGVFDFVNVMGTGEVDPKGSVFPMSLRSPGDVPALESSE